MYMQMLVHELSEAHEASWFGKLEARVLLYQIPTLHKLMIKPDVYMAAWNLYLCEYPLGL